MIFSVPGATHPKIVIPPIKCQGIKTKLVPFIKDAITSPRGRWIEPFCGSCVVALNVRPEQAILADTNRHIIQLYCGIQSGKITAGSAKSFLEEQGALLARHGEAYYYQVRQRFNTHGDPLDFLFLNRSCFNGLMRFNRQGMFNVSYGHNAERFRRAYITKITNQISTFAEITRNLDWRFIVAPFTQTLELASASDFVYADPPYAGRHADYFTAWRPTDETRLIQLLKGLPGPFLLSMWYGSRYRNNPTIAEQWPTGQFPRRTAPHYYHVGSTQERRHTMTEALIANYQFPDRTTPNGSDSAATWTRRHSSPAHVCISTQ